MSGIPITISHDDVCRVFLEPILRDKHETPERRALAYAALTLARLLANTWTHGYERRGEWVTETRLSGQLVGPAQEVRDRLHALFLLLFPSSDRLEA